MTDSRDTPPDSPGPTRRRSSFAGQTFADLFGTGRARPAASSDNSTSNNSPPPGQTVSTAAALQAQRRRVSISTLGLSGSPSQTSPFGSFRRRDSISSANSGSLDESAIEEDGPGISSTTPTTPFGRRMSFGARALRDVKAGSGGGAAGGGGGGGGGDKGLNDGYNWADNFRNRAERSSSIASVGATSSPAHVRAKSVATQPPVKQIPQANVPDHFQERILKGDFYMD